MGKLILADVDGTILRHDAEEATSRVAEVVARMLEESNVLVPVTSRTAKLMGRLAMQLGLRHLGVLDGGATLFDFHQRATDSTLSRWIDPDRTNEVIGAIGHYCDEIYYGEDSLLHLPDAPIDDSSPSVFAVYPNEAGVHVSRALSAIVGVGAHTNKYGSTDTHSCVQVVSQGVSKQSGVRLLLADPRYANFAPQDIVAIGDGDPDKDLLLAVPRGARRIAIGNNPTLLEVANAAVPPASEDGFAIAMERFVLR